MMFFANQKNLNQPMFWAICIIVGNVMVLVCTTHMLLSCLLEKSSLLIVADFNSMDNNRHMAGHLSCVMRLRGGKW